MTPIQLHRSDMLQSDAALRHEIVETLHAAEAVARRAIRCGQLLIERREALMAGQTAWKDNTKPTEDQFSTWLTRVVPELSVRTAYRWMEAAERTQAALAAKWPKELDLPTSQVISADGGDTLTGPARQAHQLWLDFTGNKTIADILRDVTLDGDKPHRITRAHAGQACGGYTGEDRADYPAFLGRALVSAIYAIGERVQRADGRRGSVGGHWYALADDQRAEVKEWLTDFCAGCPVEVLKHLRDASAKELKERERGRAAQPAAVRKRLSTVVTTGRAKV